MRSLPSAKLSSRSLDIMIVLRVGNSTHLGSLFRMPHRSRCCGHGRLANRRSSTSAALDSRGSDRWRMALVRGSRRSWRKLHLAVDADSGEIIAQSLTDQETGDASQLEPLLAQIAEEIDQFTADGAYDGYPSYDAVLRHSAGARVVIPPRSNAIMRTWPGANWAASRAATTAPLNPPPIMATTGGLPS